MGSLSLRSLSPEATCPTGPLERIWLLQVGAGLLPRVEAWLTDVAGTWEGWAQPLGTPRRALWDGTARLCGGSA